MERRYALRHNQLLLEKIQESLSSVLPITAIVLIISITVAPLTPGTMVLFLFGALLLVLGMGLFTLGVDMSMIPMGDGIGVQISKAKRVGVPLLVCFVLGVVVTVAEPDLQVLAEQLPSVPNMTLILAVAVGVGFFLVLAQVRMLLNIPLSHMLVFFYILVFALSYFAPDSFIPAAFDSGGVTTGPITVPFIMALGIGMAAVRSDKNSSSDSFGLVSLCSIGPILSVMILGIVMPDLDAAYTPVSIPEVTTTQEAAALFVDEIPAYVGEVAAALLPIIVIFALFQMLFRRFQRHQLGKMVVGLVYTYVGLVLFLVGVNVGFMPAGATIGASIASGGTEWLADRGACRLLYCPGGAGGSGASPAGRRGIQRLHSSNVHQPCPVHRHCSVCGPGYATDLDRHLDYVVSYSRLCSGPGHDLLCTADVHRRGL